MRLSSELLDTFLVVASELSFVRSASVLHVTQSALTRRIQKLEEQAGHQLVVRSPSGLRLTEPGRTVLRYAHFLREHQRELTAAMGQLRNGELGGFFRIAAFSSVLRSVVLPVLARLLRAHPRLSCHACKSECHALHGLLLDGKADYCISLTQCARMGVENVQIGTERNVLIESSRFEGRSDCYIDHDPDDAFTEKFFLRHTAKGAIPKMLRAYFDDIYGLIDAVEQGVGRAVVPLHLLGPDRAVRVVEGFAPFDVPVYLHYFAQPSYTRLHTTLVDTLVDGCPTMLSTNAPDAALPHELQRSA